jgi:hypothetical protein
MPLPPTHTDPSPSSHEKPQDRWWERDDEYWTKVHNMEEYEREVNSDPSRIVVLGERTEKNK